MDALLVYNGKAVNGDDSNTAGAYVKRKPDKSIQVGAVQVAGNAALQQGLALQGVAVSASQTIDTTAFSWEVSATGGAVTLTLPPVATVPNQVYELVKTDASGNAAGFQASAGETINGSTGVQSTSTQYGLVRVKANAAGTAWYLW
jgi:hypothetical protein